MSYALGIPIGFIKLAQKSAGKEPSIKLESIYRLQEQWIQNVKIEAVQNSSKELVCGLFAKNGIFNDKIALQL